MKRLYLLVTADEFELPVYIETSWRKLAKNSHIPLSTLKLAYVRGSIVRKRYKIQIVEI